MQETLKITNLGQLKVEFVNIERAMRMGMKSVGIFYLVMYCTAKVTRRIPLGK